MVNEQPERAAADEQSPPPSETQPSSQAPPSMGASRSPQQGPVSEAERDAAEISTADQPLGPPGPPFHRRSPFLIGLTAAAGVAVTAGLVMMLVTAREMLLLAGLGFFLAAGLEPVVSWLVRRRVPRSAAVTAVLVAILAIIAGFLAAAIPPLTSQATRFAQQVPAALRAAQDPQSAVGQLNARYGLADHAQQLLSGQSSGLAQGLLGAGQMAFSAASSALVVVVLLVYFLVTMPRIRAMLYRLAPAARRPRAVLLGDEVFVKVGGYVLGMAVLSLIAGATTFVLLLLLGVPYPLLLAVLVALLDVVPVVGSITAGVVASLVALTVSGPVALVTAAFFVVYRFFEDYVLLPQIIGRTIQVPAVVTVLAVLLGGSLLGVLGAVIAIPLAGVLLLLLREMVLPRLDRS